MAKKTERTEEQANLPGIPEAPPAPAHVWRINYQFQGPNYMLRAGSLVMPGNTISEVRIVANGILKDRMGDKWFNVTSIVQLTPDEVPF